MKTITITAVKYTPLTAPTPYIRCTYTCEYQAPTGTVRRAIGQSKRRALESLERKVGFSFAQDDVIIDDQTEQTQ